MYAALVDGRAIRNLAGIAAGILLGLAALLGLTTVGGVLA